MSPVEARTNARHGWFASAHGANRYVDDGATLVLDFGSLLRVVAVARRTPHLVVVTHSRQTRKRERS